MSAAADIWALDPTVQFLNHGSYGACPRPVLDAQRAWRDRVEANPGRFFGRDLEGLLDAARGEVASFVGAAPDDIAFVANATAGVAAVLRSLPFSGGDEILVTDHEYGATLNTARFVAERTGALLRVARIPFPIAHEDEAITAVLAAVTPRTRIAIVSHVTSPSAIVLPVERIVEALAARGIDTLVDGAHAPGMIELSIERIGAAYYVGSGHKWLCGPKGVGFLHVRRDRQATVHPLVASHGMTSPRTDRSRFRLTFDWTGTHDPTAALALPSALALLGGLLAGGWPALREANHRLALTGARTLRDTLGTAPGAPDNMLGSMAAVLLPSVDGVAPDVASVAEALVTETFEVPVYELPVLPEAGTASRRPASVVRISAQSYNSPAQYEALGEVLARALRS